MPGWRRVRPWMLVAAAYVVGVVVWLPAFAFPHFEDTALFAAIGHYMREGLLPYRDIVDQKPPGIFWLAYLTDLLLGRSSEAARFVELLVVGALAAACGRIARSIYGGAADRAAVVVTFVASSSLFWGLPERGQVEWPMMALVSWGVALLVDSCRTPSNRRLLGAGICFGAAGWVKPNALIFAVAAWLAVISWWAQRGDWRRIGRSTGMLAAGAVASSLPFLIWLMATGILDDLVRQMVVGNRGYLARGPDFSLLGALRTLEHWPVESWVVQLWAAAAVAGGLCLAVRAREASLPGGRLLLAWLLAAVVSFALGRYLFYYHRIVLVPVIAVLATGGLVCGWRQGGRLADRGVRPALVTALRIGVMAAIVFQLLGSRLYADNWRRVARVVAGPTSWQRLHQVSGREMLYYDYAAQLAAARYVRDATAPGDSVYLFGRGGVFWLHVDRRPASRYLVTSSVFNDPAELDQLLADLEADPPAMVLVRMDDAMPWFNKPPSMRQLESEPRLRAFLAAYQRVTVLEDRVAVYRRSD